MFVKICGICDSAGAAAAAEAEADAVGFVFAESPRRVSTKRARSLAAELHPWQMRVAVLHLPGRDEVLRVLEDFGPDALQVEPGGSYDPAFGGVRWWPVLHDGGEDLLQLAEPLPPDEPVLVEAAGRGGRGRRPDWGRTARLARARRVILAGGLRPDNVAEAIEAVGPWGVDVSSGVEASPGRKSGVLITAFVRNARNASAE